MFSENMDRAVVPPAGRILTLNLDGSYGICTRKRAKRFAMSGRADWCGEDRIRFRPQDERAIRVSAAVLAESARRCGYDHAAETGMAPVRAIANVPIERPTLALNCGQRSQGCGPLHRH